MIVSKNALQAVLLTVTDKQVPALDNVHIREDGGVVAANRDSVILVSPVSDEIKASFPVKGRESEEVTISSESVKDVIKYIGADKRFNGLLENCDVVKKDDKVEIVCYDGKRTKVLEGKCYPDYFDYKALFQRVHGKSIQVKMILNLKRLRALVETMDKVTDDRGDFSPIFFEFTQDGDVIMRSIDSKTGTRVLAVCRAVPGVKEIPYSAWEKQFVKIVTEEEPKPSVRERHVLTKNFSEVKEDMMSKGNVFIRERKPVVAPVNVRQRQLPGSWHIIDDECMVCGNHLRENEKGKKSCSYVKCENHSKYL